jgi:hypothetical protein
MFGMNIRSCHRPRISNRANSLLSLSRRPTRLPASPGAAPAEVANAPFAVRMLGMLLRAVADQNERLVGLFEQELRTLEEVPVRDSRPEFFERTFRLKKELSAAQADLWRLKSVLAEFAEGRTRLPGARAGGAEAFGRLAADADYLYETVVNIREEALSLIELHINAVSFAINRVMRLLAVVSVLGLVPAVVGGLFGMNLADNSKKLDPWRPLRSLYYDGPESSRPERNSEVPRDIIHHGSHGWLGWTNLDLRNPSNPWSKTSAHLVAPRHDRGAEPVETAASAALGEKRGSFLELV